MNHLDRPENANFKENFLCLAVGQANDKGLKAYVAVWQRKNRDKDDWKWQVVHLLMRGNPSGYCRVNYDRNLHEPDENYEWVCSDMCKLNLQRKMVFTWGEIGRRMAPLKKPHNLFS